uniref:Uncharacterized protein n=1 Tax=Bracon brevicornis TaxID=1563983 RepID=A0A6V7JH84_9HYME
MVSDDAEDDFKDASGNIRTNIALEIMDTNRPICFRDSLFNSLCYPIMPINSRPTAESLSVDHYDTKFDEVDGLDH